MLDNDYNVDYNENDDLDDLEFQLDNMPQLDEDFDALPEKSPRDRKTTMLISIIVIQFICWIGSIPMVIWLWENGDRLIGN